MRQPKRANAGLYRMRISCLFLTGVVLSAILLPLRARADGGAPNLAYVAGSRYGVGIIDVAQQKLARGFTVAGSPNTLLLSSDGALLYVTQPMIGRVSALAARTGQLICSASFPGHPSLLALSIDGTTLYVAGINERNVFALDSRTCALQRSFLAPEPVFWLSVAGFNTSNTLQTQLWMAGNTAVSVLDDRGQVLASILVAGGAQYLCLPSGLTAYIVTRQGRVLAADMLSHRVFATLLTGGTFGSMDYDAVTGEIYVPDLQHNQIEVLIPVLDGSPLATREPARIIHVRSSPYAIAITNDGQFGFVARSGGKVDILDIPGRSLVRSILVGGEPHFVITGPYPPVNVPIPISLHTASSPANILPQSLLIALLSGAFLSVSWFIWRQRKRLIHRKR